jgi:hypothetical protein
MTKQRFNNVCIVYNIYGFKAWMVPSIPLWPRYTLAGLRVDMAL